MGEIRGKGVQTRQKKREAEEADKVEVVPRVAVGTLRRFRATSIRPTQEPQNGVGCAGKEA